MKKRVFALLLTMVMLFGMLPVSAFATEAETPTEPCTTEGCTYGADHAGKCSNFVACETEGCEYAAGHDGNCSNYVEPTADELAAQQVVALISVIGDVTLESEAAISAAETAYNALSDAQKALVTNADVLEAAKAAYMALSVPAPITDAIVIETGHVAEFMNESYLSKIELLGVSGTVSGSGQNWTVELPEGTDPNQSITLRITASVSGAAAASRWIWVNDTCSEETVADTNPNEFSWQPEWQNGSVTLKAAVGTDAKKITTYTIELSIKGLVKEEYNTAKLSEQKSKDYFVTKIQLSGTEATALSVTDTDFSGSSSGHKATVEYTIDGMPTEPLGLTFTMAKTGDAYISCNGDSRVEIDGTYETTVDLNKGTVFTFITYSTKSNATVRGTYTVKFNVLGVDLNTAPTLKDGSVTEEKQTITAGKTFTINVASLFQDAQLDALNYTVEINGEEPVAAEGNYSRLMDKTGDFELVFRANDGKKTSEDSYTVKLQVEENIAPALTGAAAGTGTVDQYSGYSLDLTTIFTDANNDPMTYTVKIGTNDAVNAAANYTYTANEAGTVTLVFQAKDHALTSPEYTVTLTVTPTARTSISSTCTGSTTGDTWMKSVTITGGEVLGYKWNKEAGHSESEEHVLNIRLADTVADDALLYLSYTAGYAYSSFKGSVSGPSSVTLVDGEGSVKVTAKGWMDNGVAKTYIINFTNKANNAPVATQATGTAQVNTGGDFTIDLTEVFSDPDGDELIYTVTVGEETGPAESIFTQKMGSSGEFTFLFTATDVWMDSVTHTVTVTVKQSDATYDAVVKVPEGITPEFFVTSSFDGENGDVCGDALTATADTAAEGFVPYTVKVPEGVDRISFRGIDADGNNWGGMSAAVAKDTDPVTVVKVLGVIPSKINNVYATAEQALFQLKDKDGNYAVSGSHTTDEYGIVNYRFLAVAFGTDDLALAYTAYVVPQGGTQSQYLTTIGNNKTFTKDEPEQITRLSMTLKSAFTVTVPEGATVQAFQWQQYYKANEITVSEVVANEDGTENWIFVKGNASYMTYRASMEGKLTKVGYVNGDSVTITWTESDPSPDCRTPYNTALLYGARGDDSMVVNVNPQNNLVMANGGSFRLRGYRIWEVINNDTNNVMIQPDMNYTVTGDNILTVTPVTSGNGNAKNNWLDLSATGNGVAYLEMSYDAMQVVTGNAAGWGGEELAGSVFNACDPARTALVVVQVGNAARDVSFGIQCLSTYNSSEMPWDAEFDTLYFFGNSGELMLAPTVSSGSIAKVEVSGNKGVSWTELTAAEGVYTANIVPGNNIIRVTKDDGTEAYQVVRGDKISYTVTEQSGDGDNTPEPGETFRVQLYGLHNPIGKMSGNYNPGYQAGQHLYYKFNNKTVSTTGTFQYDFVSNAWVDVKIPEDAVVGTTYTLTNGYIGFNVMGITDFLSSSANHRGITDAGCMGRGSSNTDHRRSLLPEITITVRNSEAEIQNVLDLIDAIESATDKTSAISAAREAYAALSKEQKQQITNYSKLTEAEKALADAADAAAAGVVEEQIRAIGEVTLEKETAILAVREAYNVLTAAQKALVDPELLKTLEDAEAQIPVLKDKKAAQDVDAKILAVGEVTLEKEGKIEEAKAAYTALTPAQKKHVTKLSVLEDAEQKLKMLKNTGGIDYGLNADEIVGYVTVSFEDFGVRVEGETVAVPNPRGVMVSATKVPFKPYDTVASVTLRLLKAKGITASYQGDEFSGFYLSDVGGLGEFDAGSGSGWMVTLNGWFINKGASEFAVKDGDVVKWQYTCQLGADIGDTSFYGSVTEVIKLINAIGTVTENSGDAIKAARAAYDELSDTDKKRVSNYAKLTEAETAYEALLNEAKEKVETLINTIGTVTLDRADEIAAARKAYNALPTAQKLKVSNYETLTAAESKLEELQKEEDEKAAKKVEELIDKLDSSYDSFEEDAEAAKKAYDALTSPQKKLVGNYYKLANALKLLADEQDIEAAERVDTLINAIGLVALDSEEKIMAAREAYDKLTDAQKALVENIAALEAAEEKLAELKNAALGQDVYKATGDYLENLGTPTPGSVGGEWMVIGLLRSDRKVTDIDAYYEAAVKFVQENVDENGRLHNAKSTENARMILALTAMGKDVTNVGGYNLLTGLNNMEYVQKQGINGSIWALLALDSGNYPAPEGNVTREALLQVIVDAQLADGGWALSGSVSDPDMTGMALQALAPYYKTNAAVNKSVNAALIALSDMQAEDGSFASIDGSNSESVAQVIAALSALGIDADADPRFIKNGISALDALCEFFVEGGGFRHVPGGKLDGMATEQSYYALTAYYRMRAGKTALFDMTDVVDMGGDPVMAEPVETLPTEPETEPVPTEPAETPAKNGRSFPWWLVIVIVVLAGAIVVLVIISKPKKGNYAR